MPFIPHTEQEIRDMLDAIGASSIEGLFDEIPADLRAGPLHAVPERLAEMEVQRLMRERAERDGHPLCFIGAGAYEHHIPAAVWEITTRGEFYSAYTPYQAEASQGTLQLLYEYQSMMASLTGMDVANASMYDGASALAEAVLMAVRSHKSGRRILMPATVHPIWRSVVKAIVKNQAIELVELPYDARTGRVDPVALHAFAGQDMAALVVPQPNFFGVLEDVDSLTDWAQAQNMLVIGVVNPTSLALLKAPGDWGQRGADIVVGEGQPLGIPLSSGGPYFGLMTCKMPLVRQMPGRIIGATTDLDGKRGYTLTLQAREQHIRRSKATSNICTNQGLMVTAATLYMALMGPEGLRRVAAASHANTRRLLDTLSTVPGIEIAFNSPVFHEAVVRLPKPAAEVLHIMETQGVLGGFNMTSHYPELGESILLCATETKTQADLDHYAEALAQALTTSSEARGPAA